MRRVGNLSDLDILSMVEQSIYEDLRKKEKEKVKELYEWVKLDFHPGTVRNEWLKKLEELWPFLKECEEKSK